MDHITIRFSLKTPAMHLAGYHKINLVGHYIKRFEINSMCATAPCE